VQDALAESYASTAYPILDIVTVDIEVAAIITNEKRKK